MCAASFYLYYRKEGVIYETERYWTDRKRTEGNRKKIYGGDISKV